MIDTNDIEEIMMQPECLLQVHVEASTIRELLLDFHSKIENIDKRMIDILKSRELDQLQKQIDQINTKIETIEFQINDLDQLKNSKTTPEQLNESVDRKIEEVRILNDQIFRKLLLDSINDAKSNLEESIQTNRQEIESNLSNKYATSDIVAQLQARLEAAETRMDQASPHPTSSRTRTKLTPRQANSSRNSMSNIAARDSKEKSPVAAVVTAPDEGMQNSINELKKRLDESEASNRENIQNLKNSNAQIKKLQNDILLLKESSKLNFANLDDITTNLNAIKRSSSDLKKEDMPSRTETIVKTVQQPVDLDQIKFEVSKAVLDQILPYVNDALEKVDEIQKNTENTEDSEKENRPPQFIISTTEGIFEAQPEIPTPKSENSTRGLSEYFAKRALSSSREKRNPVDPRISILETQQKALKEHVEALEAALKSQYDFIDSRLYDISLRTTSIEKHFENQGQKIVPVAEENIVKASIAIQTADDIEEETSEMVNRYTSPIPSAHSTQSRVSIQSAENRAITPTKESDEPSRQSTPKAQNPSTPFTENPPATEEKQPTPTPEKQQIPTKENPSIQPTDASTQQLEKPQTPANIEERKPANIQLEQQTIEKKSEPVNEKPEATVKQNEMPVLHTKTIVRPSSASAMSSSRSENAPRFPIPNRINLANNNSPSTKKEGLLPLNLISLVKSSSLSSRSSHSHMTSQTYEEIDRLTKQLELQISELSQQMNTVIDRLSEKDRQIHQLTKTASTHVTRDDLEEMKIEIDERNSFNRKNNPNQETVTATQLKRVVANFQGSIKSIDKQLDSMKEIVPQFVTKEELTELVEAVTQLAIAQTKENSTSTAGGTLTYKCLLCGRPTNQVTGMITEGEVARMIGEPPIIGATAGTETGASANDIVLVYGKECPGSRVTSQMASTRKKKPIPPLAKVTPNITQLNPTDLQTSTT